MRKFVLTLAAAGAALAVASPAAAAQYYPQPSTGYGYGYGNNNGYIQVAQLQYRVSNILRQINGLDRRDVIRNRTADNLRDETRGIERRLQTVARYGLNQWEAREIQSRLAVLEQKVQYQVATQNRYGYGNNGYGNNGYNGYNGYNNGYNNGYFPDRDRDGRDDRYEDDRGWRHDN